MFHEKYFLLQKLVRCSPKYLIHVFADNDDKKI